MTEFQRLFLVQARSDFRVFELLRKQWEEADLPACHALHYLQMATEKLGKAKAWQHGPPGKTHGGFKGFMKGLQSKREAQKKLGYEGRNANWYHLLRKSLPLAQMIQDLAPSGHEDKPNPEYPWPVNSPLFAPAEFKFKIWSDLQDTDEERQFLKLLGNLIKVAEAFLD
jgi:hypothetical protein